MHGGNVCPCMQQPRTIRLRFRARDAFSAHLLKRYNNDPDEVVWGPDGILGFFMICKPDHTASIQLASGQETASPAPRQYGQVSQAGILNQCHEKTTAEMNPAKPKKKSIERGVISGYPPNIAAMTISITPP